MTGSGRDSEGNPLAAPFIVFEDDDTKPKEAEPPERAAPIGIVIDTDDDRPITPTIELAAPPLPESRLGRFPGLGACAVVSLAILLVVYWTVSLGEWVEAQFHRDSALGYVILPFAVAVPVLTVGWLWREVAAWRRLVVADRFRADLSDTTHGQADRDRFLDALRRLERTMEGPQCQAIATFLAAADGNRGADELRIIFDHDVIHPMDATALAAIHRAVYDSFFLGVLSPTVTTDTAAFVIRATGMIRGVALAYGHRPGKLGLLRIMRRMLADVAILSGMMILMGRVSSEVGNAIRHGSRAASGALKMAGDPLFSGTVVAAVGELAGESADVVAAEIAEALTGATRMAQLGLLAVTVSRPLTLDTERKKDLSRRLREMIFTLRRSGQRR